MHSAATAQPARLQRIDALRATMGETAGMIDTRCWVVTDAAAGNRRQALALAAALGFAQPREWTLHARYPWRWLAPRRLPGARFAFGDAFAKALTQPPSLVIGCGRQGALASRLARESGAQAVQILDPRLDPRYWDAVIVPAHDRLRGGNVLTALGSLHPVDAPWLAAARAAHPSFGALPGPRLLLLLGGPVANVALDRHWWQATLAQLTTLAHTHASLMISVSRRTPAWLRQLAGEALPQLPGRRWLDLAAGDNPYPGMLAWADAIVVSPDSVNMISEACATTAPVLVPGMERARGRHAAFLHALRAGGRIVTTIPDSLWPSVTPLIETAQVAARLRALLARPEHRVGGGSPD